MIDYIGTGFWQNETLHLSPDRLYFRQIKLRIQVFDRPREYLFGLFLSDAIE